MNIKFLNEGTEFDVGDTIIIETTVEESQAFSDTKTLLDPTTIEITITGYNNNVVVNGASMTRNDTGEYFYNWDTTGLSKGDYEVVIEVDYQGTKDVQDEWIKITD